MSNSDDGYEHDSEELRAWENRDRLANWHRYYILDERGYTKPVEVLEWSKWFGKFENRLVERTKENDFSVTTIFLGIDSNYERFFDPLAPQEPILFETCVLKSPKQGKNYNGLVFHYSSLAAAKSGHYAIVRAFRDGSKPVFEGKDSFSNFLFGPWPNDDDEGDEK